MKKAALIATVALLVAAMAAPASAAGGPPEDGTGNGSGVGVMDQDRVQMQDQDCLSSDVATPDCTADQEQVQARDRDQARDQDCLSADCTADQERVQARIQDGTGTADGVVAARERATIQQRLEQIAGAARTAWIERFGMALRLRLASAGDDASAGAIYDGTGFANMQQWWHAWMRQLFNLL